METGMSSTDGGNKDLLRNTLKADTGLYEAEDFEKKYTYDGNDLGAYRSPETTVFKVWAPTAKSVTLNLYESGDPSADDGIGTYDMSRDGSGVWSVRADKDLAGVYYTYTADFGDLANEACDPYARAVGVNGKRAMVIDLDATDPEGWEDDFNPNAGKNSTDAVIYELHIRDLSADLSSGIKNTGKFIGLTETGTVNSGGVPTGLDHIADMGITHLQLTPVYDYATVDESKPDAPQYNWGYDPLNYNVPEGSYSTDASDGAVRVREFKQMVRAVHSRGISVVMDVVYNHTYGTDYCFNMLVPGYFHRPGSNGSECGNDVASERPMVRKFIVDSLVYWAKEYHIDGFRFDLVGLIDVETIRQARAELDRIDPSIILYGEGWDMKTITVRKDVPLAVQKNVGRIGNFAMFNDTLRDAVKGSMFDEDQTGYINGNYEMKKILSDCAAGKTEWSSLPYQQINYVSCHDNRTLWDEITVMNPDMSFEDRVRKNLLAAAIVFTSQGIPFIFAGEEFLRSKENADGTLNENSYNAPDSVNSIKWDDLSRKEYADVCEYYKGLIAFRKAHPALRRMESAEDLYDFSVRTKRSATACRIAPCAGESSDGIFVIYNASDTEEKIKLPKGKWRICVKGNRAGCESLGEVSDSVTAERMSATVLVKSGV